MPLLSTDAMVLSSLRLGEADKLITFFTLTRGKISGVAKGARRFKSRFGAALEPFTECHLVVFEKGGNKLARIYQADILHSFQKLREDWETIEVGTQMVRLVLRMTPEALPHPALYYLLREALTSLESGRNAGCDRDAGFGVDRHLSFILFMAHLIAESGYQPEWNRCVRCNIPMETDESEKNPQAFFSHPEGGLLCPRCIIAPFFSLSSGALAFLRTASKIDFRFACWESPSLLIKREVETTLKDYIAYLIGLKKEFFRSYLPCAITSGRLDDPTVKERGVVTPEIS